MTLALFEGTALFAAVCGTIFVWGHPLLSDWLDVAVVLGQAAALSLCCIIAFYYNDLYDLRIVRNLGEFASRLLQSSFAVELKHVDHHSLFRRPRSLCKMAAWRAIL